MTNTGSWLKALMGLTLASWLVACGGGDDEGGGTTTTATSDGTASIGATGGTVSTANGAAQVVFPADAFSTSTTVRVASSGQSPASSRLVAGTAHDFSAGGSLSKPAQLTLKYDASQLPSGALESRLVMYSASSGAWVAVPGSTVDTSTKAVTASVTRASTYAVLADNQFAGTYSGTYTGSANRGTWGALVDVEGRISAVATGGFSGTGAVTFTGDTTIPLAGSGAAAGATVKFAGSFALQANGTDVVARGTWTSSGGDSGSWTGSKQP